MIFIETFLLRYWLFSGTLLGHTSWQTFLVTSRPERVYDMCNHMCTKGFLNYFSVIIEFLKVVLRVKL